MLETLDVLIGFTLVMLIMSMAVTMLTQLIGSALLNLRGRALRIGTARLLALLDRGLSPPDARQIADHILRNPLVGQPKIYGDAYRLAPVVHREELIRLILDFAADDDAEKADPQTHDNETGLRVKIRQSLRANGIEDPKEILEQIRRAAVELERTSPEMSHSMRLNIAILTHAGAGDFLSKINGWFDQTIDRVSDAFTSRTRIVTATIALVLAFVVHLDAISLINRLSVDDALRERLVASAIERVEHTEAAGGASALPDQPSPAPALPRPGAQPGSSTPPGQTTAAMGRPGGPTGGQNDEEDVVRHIRQGIAEIRSAGLADLEGYGLVAFPRSWDEWLRRWKTQVDTNDDEPGGHEIRTIIVLPLLGILISAALLSLGAPFWYSALRDLVKLRSMVARKDDAERAERQSTQAPASTSSLRPQYRGGEAGDLEPAG